MLVKRVEDIFGYKYATINEEYVESEPIDVAFHGTSEFGPDFVVQNDGTPQRGDDIELVRHVEPPPNHPRGSAFRGTTPFPAGFNGQSASGWAGIGGWVYQIQNYRGYNIGRLLEGKIPDGLGGFRNPRMSGENETAIPAEIPRNFIPRVGKVTSLRSGNLVVIWEDQE